MSISLTDALRQVDLQAGRVYHCQIGRFRVEVRVAETQSPVLPTELQSSDVMLDPWIELPAPRTGLLLKAVPGTPVLPDAPDLPAER